MSNDENEIGRNVARLLDVRLGQHQAEYMNQSSIGPA